MSEDPKSALSTSFSETINAVPHKGGAHARNAALAGVSDVEYRDPSRSFNTGAAPAAKFDAQGNPAKEGFSLVDPGKSDSAKSDSAKVEAGNKTEQVKREDSYKEMSKKLDDQRKAAAAAEEARRLLGYKQEISRRIASGKATSGDWAALEKMNTQIFNLPKDHTIA